MSDDFRKIEESFRVDCLPKLAQSKFVIGICDPENVDGFLLMQLGAAVLLDKPLVIVALKGIWIPARMRELADEVVEIESMKDLAGQERLAQAIRRVTEKLEREERLV